MDFKGFSRGEEWYFIGIGGVSMSALAALLAESGIPVRGSDAAENRFTRSLRARGVPVSIGTGERIAGENVVFTSAVGEGHEQLAAARKAGKRLFSRAELLGKLAAEFPCVLSVAGCHGKTSTTAMLSHIFRAGGRAFTCHIGGEDFAFGNGLCAGGDYFITEACEFQRSFLSLRSFVAVILNTDRDHTDCYENDGALLDAYTSFASRAEKTVVNAEERAEKIPHALSFGFRRGDIRAENLRADGEKYVFTVTENGIPVARVRLNVVGKYQVQNALAAYAAARLCGLSAEEIARGLREFYGVKRRFEQIGTLCGAPVVCDYAHHPREIAAVLDCAQRLCDGTVRLVFQPHTYTRTRDLMEAFCRALGKAESPVIYQTYAAREPFLFEGSAPALVSRLPEAVYVQSPEQLKTRLMQTIEAGDWVLVLGAGDIYEIAAQITD